MLIIVINLDFEKQIELSCVCVCVVKILKHEVLKILRVLSW